MSIVVDARSSHNFTKIFRLLDWQLVNECVATPGCATCKSLQPASGVLTGTKVKFEEAGRYD